MWNSSGAQGGIQMLNGRVPSMNEKLPFLPLFLALLKNLLWLCTRRSVTTLRAIAMTAQSTTIMLQIMYKTLHHTMLGIMEWKFSGMFGLHGQHRKPFFVWSIFYNQSAIGVSTSEAFSVLWFCATFCERDSDFFFLKCVFCLCQHDWKSISTLIGFSLVFEEVICYDLFQAQNQYLLRQNLCVFFLLLYKNLLWTIVLWCCKFVYNLSQDNSQLSSLCLNIFWSLESNPLCNCGSLEYGATVNQHPQAHHEGWMVSGQETVFCWVLVL